MESDWEAVARALRDRLDELRMTMTELAARSRVSLSIVRELAQNTRPRRRQPRTLDAMSEALGWPSDYLEKVLRGQRPAVHEDEAADPVLNALTEIRETLQSISERVSALEDQLSSTRHRS